MKIEDRMPQGHKVDDGRPMGDAGCRTGCEDAHMADGVEKGYTGGKSFAGGKQRGDGMKEC